MKSVLNVSQQETEGTNIDNQVLSSMKNQALTSFSISSTRKMGRKKECIGIKGMEKKKE